MSTTEVTAMVIAVASALAALINLFHSLLRRSRGLRDRTENAQDEDLVTDLRQEPRQRMRLSKSATPPRSLPPASRAE